MQKWYNAYDEAIRVPLIVKGPGVVRSDAGVTMPTSHVDLVPTLLGLAGIDVERAATACRPTTTRPSRCPGVTSAASSADRRPTASPGRAGVLHDRGRHLTGSDPDGLFNGEPFDRVANPSHVESVIGELPTGVGGAAELWKLNHYYERLDEWHSEHGIASNPFLAPAAEPMYELHNLTRIPRSGGTWPADADGLARTPAERARGAARGETALAGASQSGLMRNEGIAGSIIRAVRPHHSGVGGGRRHPAMHIRRPAGHRARGVRFGHRVVLAETQRRRSEPVGLPG